MLHNRYRPKVAGISPSQIWELQRLKHAKLASVLNTSIGIEVDLFVPNCSEILYQLRNPIRALYISFHSTTPRNSILNYTIEPAIRKLKYPLVRVVVLK